MDNKTREFIVKAKLVHGEFYSYDKTFYLGNKIKVTIVCPIHGDFQQLPSNHLKYKCAECSRAERSAAKIAQAKSEYIEKVKAIHGEKYDVSKIEYLGSKHKVVIGCYIHGFFELAANHFLSGSGCNKCGKEAATKKIIQGAKSNFEQKAREIHGDNYDYQLVNYSGYKEKVTITCPEHGNFLQTPRKHLEGFGCVLCGRDRRRLTTEEFIERAEKQHNYRYDYSKTEFLQSHILLSIICPEHGEFQQNPHNHLAGAGCKKCADNGLRKTNDEFAIQAHTKHGHFYSYDFVDYEAFNKKVVITCTLHGNFAQRPVLHLQGFGCTKCSIQKRAQKSAHSTIQFVNDANFIHDNRWSYEKTTYVNNHTKVVITCSIHGDFEQTPGSHKSGRGCPKCGVEKSTEASRMTKDEFIAKSREMHADKYIYDLVEYKTNHESVRIKCYLHGLFSQRPSSHMRGTGCPICANTIVSNKLSLPFEVFEQRANEIHENKYKYDSDKYKKVGDKLTINCLEHGDFEQYAFFHLQGGMCPKCKQKITRMQTEEFLVRAKHAHGDRYGYQFVDCNGTDSMLKIDCKTHGLFEQKASQHIKGSGCRNCYVDSTRMSQMQFINDCRAKHGDRYDYSKVIYSNIRNKVLIRCSEHGEFAQTAHDHKHGGGCPQCAEYFRNLDNKDPETPCYLYYLALQTGTLIFYKVGITTVGIEQRFNTLKKDKTQILDKFYLLTSLREAIIAEQQILNEFSEYKLLMSDTLIYTGGGTECFADNVLGLNNLSLEDYVSTIEA